MLDHSMAYLEVNFANHPRLNLVTVEVRVWERVLGALESLGTESAKLSTA